MFNFDTLNSKLVELQQQQQQPEVWQDRVKALEVGREIARLERIIEPIQSVQKHIISTNEILELALADSDESLTPELGKEAIEIVKVIDHLEFQRMFSGELDGNNAYLDIQAGSGGTEAQDWANMLLRMYLRFAEAQGFSCEILEKTDGEVAGIKGATLLINGDHAFGWLRTETGVHRLVRKSPFDSGNRRHTSFASIFVSPEIDETIEIDINPSDLRVDTYRSSGAGGQHVNTTDSAVRITHIPSGVVVQCQNQRSQHQNRDKAMQQLRAKLYEIEMQKQRDKQNAVETEKKDIGWGSQIRSYVLDQARIKDLRTGYEQTNTQAVLDGDVGGFIQTSLKQGL